MSQNLQDHLSQAAPLGLIELDGHMTILACNPAASSIFSIPENDLRGLCFADLIPGGVDSEAWAWALTRPHDWVAVQMDGGGIKPTSVRVRCSLADGGHVVVAIEPAYSSEAEAGLRRSERLLRDVLDNTTSVVFIKDLAGKYVMINRRYAELFNVDPDKFVGQSDYDLFDPDTADKFRCNDVAVIESGVAMEFEEAAPHPDGSHTYFSVKFPWRDAQGNTIGVAAICMDITRRKSTERQLARQVLHAQLLHRAMAIANDAESFEGAVREGIRAVCEVTGWLAGRLFFPGQSDGEAVSSDFCHNVVGAPEVRADDDVCRQAVATVYRSGRPHIVLSEDPTDAFAGRCAFAIRASGRISAVMVFGMQGSVELDHGLAEVLEVVGDHLGSVQVRKRTEQDKADLQNRLLSSQKMEAMGQLASGVAHDFNNLLTVMLGGIEQVEAALGDGHSALKSVGIIQSSADEAAELTQALVAFSRSVTTQRKPVEMSALFEATTRMIRRMWPAAVELTIIPPPQEALWVHGDSAQLQQVLIHLALHARDVQADAGSLAVALARVAADQVQASGLTGPAVSLTFSQTQGPDKSMAPPARRQATGLSLSIVHTIVQAHGGVMDIEARFNEGAVVTILLPVTTPVPGNARNVGHGHGELVLLAEDNPQVRGIISSALQSFGFSVVKAVDGAELIAAFDSQGDRVQLMVIDVDLPREDGLSCVERIRGSGCATPVILITGKYDTAMEDRLDCKTVILRKPFQMAELGRLADRLVTRRNGQEDAE
jgi:PAS domain S-box-containing protein